MDKPIHILLTDDEESFTEPIAFWLKSRGYVVSIARNGKEAIQKVRENPPDILFMDINMPVMNGLQALNNIRLFNQDLPVVMITSAYSDEDNVTRAKELGISGFFVKSRSFDEMVQMIRITLKTHKNLKSSPDEAEYK
jgi:CheY-like chemotaxis protein